MKVFITRDPDKLWNNFMVTKSYDPTGEHYLDSSHIKKLVLWEDKLSSLETEMDSLCVNKGRSYC